jgi:hypothetical protein
MLESFNTVFPVEASLNTVRNPLGSHELNILPAFHLYY